MVSATIDIIATKFFNYPIPGTTEIIEDLNIPIVFMGMAYVQLTSGHLAGPVFEKQFSKNVNKAIKIISCLLGISVCGLIAWQGLLLLIEMIAGQLSKTGTVQFVLWPFALGSFLGFALVTISFILSIVRLIAAPDKKNISENKEEIPIT
jgi:TRAP-type C4-dicarboxylate transport system permease small subunit